MYCRFAVNPGVTISKTVNLLDLVNESFLGIELSSCLWVAKQRKLRKRKAVKAVMQKTAAALSTAEIDNNTTTNCGGLA